MPKTRAQKNREIRQEATREHLKNLGLVQHVIDIANKLGEPAEDISSTQVSAMKASADIRLKLIDKYLPSLQSIESTIEDNRSKPVEKLTEDELDALIADAREREEAQDQGEEQLH